MRVVHDLNLVGYFVRANFLCVEKVNDSNIIGHVELPISEETFTQTMNWLVSLDDIEGVQIGY